MNIDVKVVRKRLQYKICLIKITKKLEIVISPSILTLHMKRFEDFAHKFNGPIDFKYNIDITK